MIFDAHLHLSPGQADVRFSSQLAGGLAISRSAADNEGYVRATRKLGLNCAVFVGRSERDLSQVVQWIEDGSASAYDHAELRERVEPKRLSSVCHASLRAGVPLVLHLSHHDHRRTPPSLVNSCVDYLTERFPKLKVIIAHLAGENFGVVLRRMSPNPNVFFDISRLDETAKRAGKSSPLDLLREVSEAVSATRIIFGTDQICFSNPTSSPEYAAVRQVFSDIDCAHVLANNALTLFRRMDGSNLVLA